MKILVLNSGSSSIKYKLFDISKNKETLLDKGMAERVSDHKEALSLILKKIDSKIEACGHRVVHGGDRFKTAALIDETVMETIEHFSELAPLHNPPALLTINESKKLLPDVPHVAVFDTAFFQTMPECAYLYAIPYALYEKHKIRKYGFHGTSHKYVAGQAARILKKSIDKLKIITCHLGNGCSIAAVKSGKAIDTSMGFTPLEGLIMGTRSGDIDPTIVSYIMKKQGVDIDRAIEILNKESGLLGISGISNDMREIVRKKDDKRSALALKMFAYRIKKYIGAYIASMGGVDAVVFTGGIGENHPNLVKEICKDVVSPKVRILSIPTDEELMIARDTYENICR
ncbi:MAG: acetate kinase [Candidatus Gorgyraea atricola]|nr:acetate kinase [Candidatus Gorgyraea atricola]